MSLNNEEVERLVASAGGLWGVVDLISVCGPEARSWAQSGAFPRVAWKTGRRALYVGSEVVSWLEATGRYTDAEMLSNKVVSLKREKRQG